MLATASVQDQGRTGASLAIVLWRVVDEDVSVGVNGLRIESKEVVQELGRSLTRLRSPERHGLGGVARTFEMDEQVGRRKAQRSRRDNKLWS